MYGRMWGRVLQFATIVFATACLLTVAHAQVTIGETSMSLNGLLGVGYSGEAQSNPNLSSHGVFLSGQAQLTGSYYDPKFLAFDVNPYFNRTQASSSFGSIFDETGISAAVSLFSGGHFPGSVSYSRTWSNGSNYGLPGTAGLSANGDTQTFGINWSALFPDWPTLSVSFVDTSSSDFIIGQPGATDSHIKTFMVNSSYSIDGWHFFGEFSHQNYNLVLPEFIAGPDYKDEGRNNNFTVTANHSLPWNGQFLVGYSRLTDTTTTDSYQSNGTADNVYGTVGFALTQNLSVSGTVRYYDNLLGALYQSGFQQGLIPVTLNNSAHGIVYNVLGSYSFGHNLILNAYANRAEQYFQGITSANNQYGATVTYNYTRPLFGVLNFSFGLVNNASGSNGSYGYNQNQGSLAFVGSLGFAKQISNWIVNADVSYNQALQSYGWYTTSNYGFGGMVRRRFGQNIQWSATARDISSALAITPGYENKSQTYQTTLTRGRIGVSGSYSKSSGMAILATNGQLVPTPLAPFIAPGETLYNSSAYGGTFSIIPLRKMTVNTSWFRVISKTTSNLSQTGIIYSNNDNDRIYATLMYKFRKLDFNATYWRINQQISATGLPRVTENNYSFTISRWFNVF